MGYLKKKDSIPYQFKAGDEKEIISKIEYFCAYTERCETDVIKKLRAWKVPTQLFPEIINYLKEQKFIHQERFGQLYVTMKGKLYRNALQKGYESSLISKWLEENDEKIRGFEN